MPESKNYLSAAAVLPAEIVTEVQQLREGHNFDCTFRPGGPLLGKELALPEPLALRIRDLLHTVKVGAVRVYFAAAPGMPRGFVKSTPQSNIMRLLRTRQFTHGAVADACNVAPNTVYRAAKFEGIDPPWRGRPPRSEAARHASADLLAIITRRGLLAVCLRENLRMALARDTDEAVAQVALAMGDTTHRVAMRAEAAGWALEWLDTHPVAQAAAAGVAA